MHGCEKYYGVDSSNLVVCVFIYSNISLLACKLLQNDYIHKILYFIIARCSVVAKIIEVHYIGNSPV